MWIECANRLSASATPAKHDVAHGIIGGHLPRDRYRRRHAAKTIGSKWPGGETGPQQEPVRRWLSRGYAERKWSVGCAGKVPPDSKPDGSASISENLTATDDLPLLTGSHDGSDGSQR